MPNILSQYKKPLSILIILFITIWLRLPYLKEGSPYFYREDEAHHFNRIANMMKSGELNPHYFHKPSLHFYLRLPVISSAFLWSVKKGEIKNVNEVITHDPFGIADYAFSVSHPRLLYVSRGFSLLLQLGSILLTFLIARRLISGFCLPTLAALSIIVSPSAISESCVIGVDGVMTFFCLATVYFALNAWEQKTKLALFWCACSAGLALSSKYNALPILLVPILVFIFQKPKSFESGLIAFFVPGLAFLAASPFILSSIPEFLNQFAYEIWHYGIAGHEGHMAEPGIAQALFYFNWLGKEALGWLATALTLAGILLLSFSFYRKRKLEYIIFLAFPICFIFMMVMQKANFERNMVVVLPFLAIFAAITLNTLRKSLPKIFIYILAAISLIQPLTIALQQRSETADIPETRIEASKQIEQLAIEDQEIAIDGKLQFHRKLLERAGISRVELNNLSALKIYQDGFDFLVIPLKDKSKIIDSGLFETLTDFQGNELNRIVKNPALSILKRKNFSDLKVIDAIAKDLSPIQLEFNSAASTLNLDQENQEGHLWLQKSVEAFKIKLKSGAPLPSELTLRLFSPWKGQNLNFFVDNSIIELSFSQSNEQIIKIPLPQGKKEQIILIKTAKVHSPKALGISLDPRRLAVAIKQAALN